MDKFKGIITQDPLGGTVTLSRVPVRDGGIYSNEARTILRVIMDEFTVNEARAILSSVGYTIVDDTVHGVGFGKDFFFDFWAVPA